MTTKYAPIVQLKSGKVRGLVIGANDGLYFYQGIRYGRAERFCKPVSVEPWEDVYDATRPRAAFPQFGNVSQSWATEQSEDAHFLNVWQPSSKSQKESNSQRSVMFWIHGGGCEEGSAFKPSNDCQHLALQGDLVVVSINYRLGPLGFLYGGDSSGCPGNWALHDMLLGLNWVQENIAAFGGNPADVTVFGESAGAFAVGALILIEQTAGKLFHRAILSSGAPPRCIDSPAEALEKTIMLAEKLNIQTSNLEKMVQALKAVPFTEMQPPTYGDLGRNEWFRPVFGDELLPRNHVELLETVRPKVDLLYGTVANEGTIFAAGFSPKLMASQLSKEVVHKAIFEMMHVQGQGAHAEEIARFYTRKLNTNSSQNDFRMAIADALGDLCLLVSTIIFAETIARNVPENRYYAYQLIQRPEPVDPQLPPWLGVIHGTNNKFLFTVPDDEKMTEETHRLSTEVIRAWANFAKTGHPGQMGGVQWEEAFADRQNPVTRLLTLKWGDFCMVEGVHKEVVDFWRPILCPKKV